jgi:hypothetical protein
MKRFSRPRALDTAIFLAKKMASLGKYGSVRVESSARPHTATALHIATIYAWRLVYDGTTALLAATSRSLHYRHTHKPGLQDAF